MCWYVTWYKNLPIRLCALIYFPLSRQKAPGTLIQDSVEGVTFSKCRDDPCPSLHSHSHLSVPASTSIAQFKTAPPLSHSSLPTCTFPYRISPLSIYLSLPPNISRPSHLSISPLTLLFPRPYHHEQQSRPLHNHIPRHSRIHSIPHSARMLHRSPPSLVPRHRRRLPKMPGLRAGPLGAANPTPMELEHLPLRNALHGPRNHPLGRRRGGRCGTRHRFCGVA